MTIASCSDERCCLQFAMRMRIWKGFRWDEPTDRMYKFEAPASLDHIHADLPSIMLILFHRRGAFKEPLDVLLSPSSTGLVKLEIDLNKNAPVFLSAGNKSIGLLPDTTMTHGFISQVLARPNRRAGYPEGMTLYCFRRRFVSDMAVIQGLDKTQFMAGHRVGSNITWDKYMRAGDEVDVVAHALGYDPKTTSEMIQTTSVEVQRLPAHLRASIENEVIHLMAEHEDMVQLNEQIAELKAETDQAIMSEYHAGTMITLLTSM